MLQALQNTPGYRRERKLKVYGSVEIEKFLKWGFSFYPELKKGFRIEFELLHDGNEINERGINIKAREVLHSEEALAYRFNFEDSSIIFSGDTHYCSSIIELAEKVNLLVLECSKLKRDKTRGHLTTFQAGKIAREAEVDTILLTHFYPEIASTPDPVKEKEIREAGYEGKIIFAEDLMEVNLPVNK